MTIFTGEETNEIREIINNLKETVLQQKKILTEIKQLYGIKHLANENMVSAQIVESTHELNKLND